MDRKCIYCNKIKPLEEFSLEHIIPDALGGSLCGMVFKSNYVCQRCNSICGIWVDAPVIKNWFSQNYRFDSAREFVDIKNGSILPLMYMGMFSELSNEEKICELWLGPCGDTIYHFRNKADKRYDSIVGGDFIDIKKNPGEAYLFIATDNSGWAKTVLLSFREHFKYSRRIACNISFKGDLSNDDFFDKPTITDKRIIEKLKSYIGQKHDTQFSMEMGFDQRFLCKLALGVGFNLFGDDYLNSKYALQLRKGLWEKDFDKRSQLKIRGTGFIYEENYLSKLICYKSAHTIILISVNNIFLIGFCLYGKIYSHIMISDEVRFWENRKEYSDGIIYLIFPQIKQFLGPYDMPHYLAHKIENDYKINELEEIELQRIPFDKLPPFRGKNYNKK